MVKVTGLHYLNRTIISFDILIQSDENRKFRVTYDLASNNTIYSEVPVYYESYTKLVYNYIKSAKDIPSEFVLD